VDQLSIQYVQLNLVELICPNLVVQAVLDECFKERKDLSRTSIMSERQVVMKFELYQMKF
jgi:hypothetical protein